MRTRSPLEGPARAARSAVLMLCAGLVLLGRAWAEDDPFAKRFDTGFAKALIHAGACTVALRQSSFTYVTPYDCTAIVASYHGQPLDGLPPEAVIARCLIARIQRDAATLVACYDEPSQATISRQFTEYLDSAQAEVDHAGHASAALIAGAFVADVMYIGFRFQDQTGATMLEWYATLKRGGRGWRLCESSLSDFPSAFSATCTVAMKAHGALADAELARMSVCRILTDPAVHAQLVQPQDLHRGDMAMAVMISAQEPPLPLDGASDVAGDAGLLALCGASRRYASAGGDADIGRLWLNGNPGSIPASPFAVAAGKQRLRFCHGSIPGDACSIYLLGDGHQALSDVMLGAAHGSWKLMDGPLKDAARGSDLDGGLWDLSLHTHIWSQLAELLRTRGE
jgi:hypothetical protein